jgi:hypothetical protein
MLAQPMRVPPLWDTRRATFGSVDMDAVLAPAAEPLPRPITGLVEARADLDWHGYPPARRQGPPLRGMA